MTQWCDFMEWLNDLRECATCKEHFLNVTGTQTRCQDRRARDPMPSTDMLE